MRRAGLTFGVYVLLCAGFLRTQEKLEEVHPKNEALSQRRQEVASTSTSCCIYDRDPNHIWNRLFRLFYMRTGKNGRQYGGEELDPYVRVETRHLIEGPSHDEAMRLLDQFLQQHAELLVRDPLKRAWMQRDLIAIYNWLADSDTEQKSNRAQLQAKLREIIGRLALTDDEIRVLPDNYQEAARSKAFPAIYDPRGLDRGFLPSDLFDPAGSWVCLSEQHGQSVAAEHLIFFDGRSVFLVFLDLPGGRTETLAYLEKLRTIPTHWGEDREFPRIVPSPEPPQLPLGTRVALVRQVVLMDNKEKLVSTHLTESVQIRVYRSIRPFSDENAFRNPPQRVFELRVDRQVLFSGRLGGFHAVAADEKEFVFFNIYRGPDEFEDRNDPEEAGQAVILRQCGECHSSAGIHSFHSFSRERFRISDDLPPPKLIESTPGREAAVEMDWIRHHATTTDLVHP
jgi:hypothetical protein